MAGTIIADKIQTENSFLTLNVGQTLVATINSSGILNSSGGTMVGANGSVSNTAITGVITASQLATSLNLATNNVQVASIQTATGTRAITFSTDGKIGVGVTSPTQAIIEVAGSTGLSIKSAAGDSNGLKLSMDANGLANLNAGYASSNMSFQIGGTEKMKMDNSGRLLVGDASVGYINSYRMTIAHTDNAGLAMKYNGTSEQNSVSLQNGNGQVGRIYTSGTNTTYATSSDYRLKKNITPMTGALAKVQALNPVTYKWKSDNTDGQGFIAHELAEVVPDCVGGEKDAVDEEGNPVYQDIDTSFLVATLTAAIKEQQAIISDLKARIEVLEAK